MDGIYGVYYLFPNVAAADNKNVLSHTISEGQESGSSLAGWLWLSISQRLHHQDSLNQVDWSFVTEKWEVNTRREVKEDVWRNLICFPGSSRLCNCTPAGDLKSCLFMGTHLQDPFSTELSLHLAYAYLWIMKIHNPFSVVLKPQSSQIESLFCFVFIVLLILYQYYISNMYTNITLAVKSNGICVLV